MSPFLESLLTDYLIFIFSFITGITLLLFFYFVDAKRKKLTTSGYHTQATITEIEAVTKQRYGTTYFPVLEFKTITAELIRQRSKYPGKNQTTYQAGTQVEVYYNPSKPEDFIIVNDVAYKNMRILKTIGWIVTIVGAAGIIYCFLQFNY